MRGVIIPAVMFFEVVDLGMAVMAGCQAVIGPGFHDLFKFSPAVISPGFRKPGLKVTAPAPAAVVVGSVGLHVHEILFAHNRFDNIAHIFRHRVAEAFSNQLTRILDREFDLQIPVPVGIDFQLSFTDPLGIVLNDAFTFKIVFDVEPLQSDPDRKKFMPSLGIEPDFAFEIINGLGLDPDDVFPVLQIRTEQAVVFRGPSFGPIGPVGADQM
jgi:hypothetical protein